MSGPGREAHLVRQLEHYAHDAMEIYAVAEMQRLAVARGMAISDDAQQKYNDFVAYADARHLPVEWFTTGPYPEFKLAVDAHMPGFIDGLAATFPGTTMDFISVERQYRNQGLKGDVKIVTDAGSETSLSLKNYRGNIARPQFNSMTFRSFLLGFLFEPTVGMYVNPVTGKRFKGSTVKDRDQALIDNGFTDVIPVFHKLDAQNETLKSQFICY